MHKYNLRKDKEIYEQFCKKVISHCPEKTLRNRFFILENINRLRHANLSSKEVNDAFENYYFQFISDHDQSAALECIFEWARYFERKQDRIETLKILLYGEKFAIENHLEKDVNYQATLNLIGYTLWQIDKPKASNEYYNKSTTLPYLAPFESMTGYNAMGINYQKMDSLDLSLHYFEKSNAIAQSTQNQLFKTIIHGNAAHTLYKLKNFKQALEYAQEDKIASISNRLYENAVGALNLIVKIELAQSHYEQAKKALREFAPLMTHIKGEDYLSLKRRKEAEYLYYETTKDFGNALKSYKEFEKFEGLFIGNSNKTMISELKLDTEVKMYAREMEQKDHDRKIRSYLEIGLVLLLLTIIISITWYLVNKARAIEKDKIMIEVISKNQAEEINLLKSEIFNLLSTIKNENEKYTEIQKINSEQVPDNMSVKTNEAPDQHENELIGDVEKLKNFNLARLDQWEEFKALFTSLYPNFEIEISLKMTDVSTSELRLMMLHKLGLNSKEIAQILFISIDGVKKSKYRLYKKLSINTSEELDVFLDS